VPWKPSDAKRKTKKASTPAKQALWSQIANKLLAHGAGEGSAIRQANAVVGGTARHPKRNQ
jgi:hypothetical protein